MRENENLKEKLEGTCLLDLPGDQNPGGIMKEYFASGTAKIRRVIKNVTKKISEAEVT